MLWKTAEEAQEYTMDVFAGKSLYYRDTGISV
jgi:hypothetical protein